MNNLLLKGYIVAPKNAIHSSASRCIATSSPKLASTTKSGSGSRVPSDSAKDQRDIRNIAPTISSDKAFPSIETLELKRGSGGRSSFSGIVATVFGPGHVGHGVIQRLARQGAQVIIPYRDDRTKYVDLKLCGDLGQILYVPIHLRDEISLRKAMKYSTVVVNTIGTFKESPNFTFDQVHIEGCARIARIAREVGIRRFIHVSALGASPNPPATYIKGGSKFLISKYKGEQAVRNEFPEATIIRPSEIFGDNQSWATYWLHLWRRHYKRIFLPRGGRGIYKMPVFGPNVTEGIVNAINDPSTIGKVIEAFGPAKHELHDIIQYYNEVAEQDLFHGFSPIGDLKWRPGFILRLKILQNFRYPPVTLDRLEYETITDMPNPQNLNLFHLGVDMQKIEDKAFWMLKFYKEFGYYPDDVDELPKPQPLPVYPLYYPKEE